jgi:sugar phosphate isomerase/epimerase
MKRKQFLQSSGAALFGALLLKNKSLAALAQLPADRPMGLQLFTFFNVIDNDVSGTLKQIAAVGFKEIESAFSRKGGYYGMKPKEFASLLKDMGMSWKSHHVGGAPFRRPANAAPLVGADGKPITIPPMKNLRDNMQEVVDEVAEGGAEFLVCASTPITTLDEIKASIEVLNKADEACKKAGIGFAYHNHDAEFRTVEGQVPYEIFLSQTQMKMELDLAWATKGGKDPVDLFKQHPGRFPMWHVKDLDKEFKTILPVGEGSINFKRIFEAASTAGMKHFFVEHDMPKDPLASIQSSFGYLTKLLRA